MKPFKTATRHDKPTVTEKANFLAQTNLQSRVLVVQSSYWNTEHSVLYSFVFASPLKLNYVFFSFSFFYKIHNRAETHTHQSTL